MNSKKLFEDTMAQMFYGSKDRIAYNFWAHMVSQCSIVYENIPAPAGIYFDSTKFILIINPEQFLPLRIEERLAILKHEMLHILYGHTKGDKTRDSLLLNYAQDCAINQQINISDLPEGAILPKSLERVFKIENVPMDLTSEQYYDLLPKSQNKYKLPKPKSEVEGLGDSMDSHEVWGRSKGEQEVSEAVANRMIKTAINKSQGNLPGNISEILNIMNTKSKLSWKKILNSMIGNKKSDYRPTLKRRSRRFQERDDIRGKVKDSIFDLIAILDVSGSMSDQEISKAISEFKSICSAQNSSLRIIQVDSTVQEIKEFKKTDKQFKRNGFGGTRMYPAIEYLEKNKIQYDGLVLVTDGFIEDISTWVKKPKKPILFLTTDRNIPGISCSKYYKQFKI
jgi:predicted metal-dependent peptidase